jgi:alpha-D-xyloside xylohydrolase
LTIGGIAIHVRRDPFALSITGANTEQTAMASVNDDRNVYGLLCTPLPGILQPTENREGIDSMWTWALEPDERFYGLGEHFDAFEQRGRKKRLWTQDASGTTTGAAYKNVPFLLSSRHYGLFVHTTTPVTFQLGTSSARSAIVRVEEPLLDMFAIFGDSPKEILSSYTDLTGRATMPPRWSFGTWLSRCRYQSREEVERVAWRAREEHVPCDVLHIDPAWLQHPGLSCDFSVNEQAFPGLPGMIQGLRQQNFKVSLWELPYISAKTERYREAVRNGYLLKDVHGEPIGADTGAPPADGALRAVIDFTNPAARGWWQDLHRPLLQAGVEIFKTDFGEAVPVEAHAYNGMTGHELHNLYPLLYTETVHEVIAQETGRDGMVWGRSGWAGIQRYPAQWGGDPKSDVWSMRSSLRGGLNLGLSAPGIWAHDIGGFYGPPPSPELYIRWAQFGLLSPFARAHGTTPREPWEFGEPALSIFRRYAQLRVQLNPYLYNTAWEASAYGYPMLRPLLLEFPDDPATATIDDSYMLGSDLLVAPIFSDSPGPVNRTLYLPQGDWYDFWTDELITGGRYITRNVPLDIVPLYVRAGAILPLMPAADYVGDDLPNTITLHVYPGKQSEGKIVWNAEGDQTSLQLKQDGKRWKLDIMGKYKAIWYIQLHRQEGTIKQDLGYFASSKALIG